MAGINVLSSLSNVNTANVQAQRPTPYEAQQDFASVLKESIAKVNDAQIESDRLTTELANGGDVELHDVMIASQKASITLSATLEVRNKVVEAYQEVMRMNI